MSDEQVSDHSRRFDVHVTAESHFAWLRTRLAVERTMMAYMRTAVALIGFGFGLFQFLYKFQNAPEIGSVRFPNAAWLLGLALIFGGVLDRLPNLKICFGHGGVFGLAGAPRPTGQSTDLPAPTRTAQARLTAAR
jgi:hypothetical protein